MKSLFSSSIAILAGLLILAWSLALQGTDPQGHLRWAEVTATAESKSNENIFLASQKSGLPTAFLDKAKSVITPGATLIFTNRRADPTTQSPPNFQILVAQKDKPTGKTE